MNQPIIQLNNITKRFPGIVANDHISFEVERGSIHTLAGENGAGKSTLMNILYGLYQPDEGEILIDGRPVRFNSSKDSIACKIGMVHQHFMLIPKLTVAENIIVGQEPGSALKVDRRGAEERIRTLSETYGLRIDPARRVSELTVTEQQRVEILKILYREAEILIFDEPTAVLTPQEIDEFCRILLDLRANGKTILFISHKMAEVMKISDRITVIRLGKVVGTVEKDKTTVPELTRMMVGRDVSLERRDRRAFTGQSSLLELKNLRYSSAGVRKLNDISLNLRSGEILGVAGVDGNGQEELVQAVCGLIRPDGGQVLLKGRDITGESVRARKEAGLGLVPEDRHRDGLVMEFSVAQNLILGLHNHREFRRTPGRCGRASTSAAPTWTRRRGPCPAATSRRSSSRGRPPATRTCSSPSSPPGDWTSALWSSCRRPCWSSGTGGRACCCSPWSWTRFSRSATGSPSFSKERLWTLWTPPA